jgi:ribosomal small subunit protein bTHX
MGKGDRRTAKGKRFIKSFGKSRSKTEGAKKQPAPSSKRSEK